MTASRSCLRLLGAWLGAAPCAVAAIAGLPEAPTPRALPAFWIAVNDDLFGDAIADNDDFRTGNLNFGATYGLLALSADYSVFTRRTGIGYDQGTRSDELTATLGLRIGELLPEPWRKRLELIAGGGVRMDGHLGGANTQNDIHRYFGFPITSLAYDHEGVVTDGLGYLYARYLLARVDASQRSGRAWDVLLEGSAAGTTGGEHQGALGAELAWSGNQGSAWVGSRYQWNDGTEASGTAAQVANHERGLWLSGGLAKQDGLYLSAGFNWRTHAIAGTVGLDFGDPRIDAVDESGAPAAAPRDPAGDRQTNQSLQYFPGSSALGLQVRGPCLASWSQPRDGRGLGFEWLIDYQFGRVPGYDWPGNEVDADQITGGLAIEYTLTTPWRYGVQIQPFVYGSGGLRLERVKVIADQHRYEQDTAGGAVVQGGGGVRARFYAEDGGWYTRLWIGYGYDGWLPFPSRDIAEGPDHDRFLRPGSAHQYSVGFSTNW